MQTLAEHAALSPGRLYRVTNPDLFDAEATEGLADLDKVIGQDRAAEALQFGVGMRARGYHIFALGSRETEKEETVRWLLEREAAKGQSPSDWCYVFNFEQPDRPKALCLPSGMSPEFQADMERFVDQLQTGLSAAFESEEYQTRRQAIEDEFQKQHEQALSELQAQAQQKGLTLLRTPTGFMLVPFRDGKVVPPEGLQKLPEATRQQLEEEVERLHEALVHILHQMPAQHRKRQERIRKLNQEVARFAIHDLIGELHTKYERLNPVKDYLHAIEKDIIEHVWNLFQASDDAMESLLRRYAVNALVVHDTGGGAPVVEEGHPTLKNLLGRVEYRSVMGTLLTDFTLIKAGALHYANGGYLMLDARRVLLQPFAWEALKRTLRAAEIRIEAPYEAWGLTSTKSLEPEPIPLNVKVVLSGDRLLYYLLHALDPDFPDLFKVEADFDDEMDRTEEHERLYARLIGTLAREDNLRPLDRYAVARVVEQASRMAEDAEKLSIETRALRDLLREADYWAGQHSRDRIAREDIEQAIEARRQRSGRIREGIQERILRNQLFIDTDGAAVGQVNGLSVLQAGRDRFGRPSRITARVHLGKGDVIDIEREVELSGPIHSKGVLILASFLAARYATDTPLSLSASLVFEQSYSGVEGDSASSAELYALLSAISEVPLKQSLAVTGSVNQYGKVQPIGNVNAKIEGFFDLCKARGLTGEQGVLIPAANVQNLMLRGEVIEAAEGGLFHIYPAETISEGMELLTGELMGELQADGMYPAGSINGRIMARLSRFAEERAAFHVGADGSEPP